MDDQLETWDRRAFANPISDFGLNNIKKTTIPYTLNPRSRDRTGVLIFRVGANKLFFLPTSGVLVEVGPRWGYRVIVPLK